MSSFRRSWEATGLGSQLDAGRDVHDVVTQWRTHGRSYKGLFFTEPTDSILSEPEQQRRVQSQSSVSPKEKKLSTLADEQLANPVITRKENKSYRMSDIQNLKTFGKSTKIVPWHKVGKGNC